MPSLREIEKAMYTLWMNPEARQWLDSEDSSAESHKVVSALDKSIIAELDRNGASLYARSIAYEHQNMADQIFPYCAKAIGKDWEKVVWDYYKLHPGEHFNFNKICKEFSNYLTDHCQPLLKKYPYLAELADYEWLELEKAEDERKIELAEKIVFNGLDELNAYYPVLNQTLSVCHYLYPIPEIAKNFSDAKRPRKKFQERACNVAIYRDPETHSSRFMELGKAISQVVETAAQKPTLYVDLLKLAIALTPELDPKQAVVEFFDLVEDLHKDNIFVGSKRK